MTLILAITCKDGIVFASDGQATRVIDEKATTQKPLKYTDLVKMLYGDVRELKLVFLGFGVSYVTPLMKQKTVHLMTFN